MLTTIATLKYRNYVPHGWIAIEFCNLEFMGVNDDIVKSMDDKWNEIKFAKLHDAEIKIEGLNANKELLNTQVAELEDKYKQSKKWYRFANKQERAWLDEAQQKRHAIYDINTAIETLKNDMFLNASELHRKASELLVQNNFVLISKSSAGDECVTHTEIWHRVDKL